MYYKHGPLARTVLGANQVQGIDYAYTIQGWLKAVNGTSLVPAYDMGQDGNTAVSSQQYIGRDAYGYSLSYYDSDYVAINNAGFLNGLKAKLPTNTYRGLYNGNISSMAVNIGILNNPKLYNYTYDQLNRITAMDALNSYNTRLNTWDSAVTASASNEYQEKVTYDPNGNILGYFRNGFGIGTAVNMDKLRYNYQPGTNKLAYIYDSVGTTVGYPNDLESQASTNYTYDSIGNLITDAQAGITVPMTWSVYGKILSVTSKNVSYNYDAAGNRIGKIVTGGSPMNTWFVRDAQGNVLSVYLGATLALQEQHIYGSTRIGVINGSTTLSNNTQYLDALGNGSTTSFSRGKKLFELSNHLINILEIISDKKNGIQVIGVAYYLPDIKSAQDYYPFGMEMPGKQYNATSYINSFNGKRDDKEVEYGWQDYGMREYDRRRGQFISIDPYYKRYPFYSSYQFSGNNAISAIDLNGLEPVGSIGNGGGNFMYKSMVDKGRYQTEINGKQIDGTLLRIVDANNANFWVLKESKIVFYDDNIFGKRPVVNTEFFYYTKPPSKNIEDYNGGSWEGYETENRQAMRQSSQVANAIGSGFAAGVTLPFAIEGYGAGMGGSYLSKGLASAGFDAASQLATNGGSFSHLNLTELGASFFIQGGGWKAMMAKNAVGNFGSFNLSSGYSGIGSRGYDLKSFGSDLITTGVGTGLDLSFEGLKNLSIANKSQLTRWQNLSYKPKYQNMLDQNVFKTDVNTFFNSTPGQLIGGATNAAATNSTQKN